jgi:hypothetical protein
MGNMSKGLLQDEEKVNHYDVNEVIDRFDIDKVFDCKILNRWLEKAEGVLKPFQQEMLEEARTHLVVKWNEWNEEELKVNFIGIVLFASQLDEPKRISTYFERRLVGKVKDKPISVKVDCMLATPMKSGRPKSPYFFLQEYKRSKGDNHDPEGQMLAAMILSQDLNADGKPLYGSWVQGATWRFTVLNGTEYCVSRTYDATDVLELPKIVFILRKLKWLILNNEY